MNLTESRVRHRDFARAVSLEFVRHLCTVHALRLFGRFSRPGAQFSRRLLPNHARTGLERFPERLSVAFPRDTHARLRLEPLRPRSVSRNSGGAKSVHGFQSKSSSGSWRRRIQSRWSSIPTRTPTSRMPALCLKNPSTVSARWTRCPSNSTSTTNTTSQKIRWNSQSTIST